MRLSKLSPALAFAAMLIFPHASLSQDAADQANTHSSAQSTSALSSQNHFKSELKPAKNILAPFTTDGCSMWIDGPPNQPSLWRHCCVAHDKAYWIGGTAQERRKSDQELQKCITDVAGKIMGDSMYSAVIPGGSPYWLTPYRWGYGWSYFEEGKLRGYKILDEDELAQVGQLLPDAERTITEDAIQHPANLTLLEYYK